MCDILLFLGNNILIIALQIWEHQEQSFIENSEISWKFCTFVIVMQESTAHVNCLKEQIKIAKNGKRNSRNPIDEAIL